MNNLEIIATIKALKEWEAIAADAAKEVEALKDSIKAEMDERAVEVLETGAYTVRWPRVSSSRFDSKAFKKDNPNVYAVYLKETVSRRFTIS